MTALILNACAASESISAVAAQAAVADSWQAGQHIVWEIDWPAAPIGGPLTVETWRAGLRYRFEILEANAPDLIGQTLIYDGQTAWRYNRFDRPSASSQPEEEARLSPVTDVFAIINRLAVFTPETATQEVVRLAHGPAQKMSLIFDNGDNFTLWQDKATGLPVRIEFVVNGQPARLRARSFEPLPDPPEGLFKP